VKHVALGGLGHDPASDGGLNALKVDPMLKNVRYDPGYKALLLKMNLPA